MRAHCNVLCVGAAVGEAEYFVAYSKAALGLAVGSVRLGRQGYDGTGELDPQCLGGLWWDRVVALTLEEVHAVQAESFDLNQGLGAVWHRLWERGVDIEGRDRACSIFDFYRQDAIKNTGSTDSTTAKEKLRVARSLADLMEDSESISRLTNSSHSFCH